LEEMSGENEEDDAEAIEMAGSGTARTVPV
jgi:hypothetical protein